MHLWKICFYQRLYVKDVILTHICLLFFPYFSLFSTVCVHKRMCVFDISIAFDALNKTTENHYSFLDLNEIPVYLHIISF